MIRKKSVHCWVCTTNQHWHQKSSMLASMLYVPKKKRVLTFQVVHKNTDISSLRCWVQSYTHCKNEKCPLLSLHQQTNTDTNSFNAGFNALQKKQTNTDINFQVFKTDFIVGFNPTSLYTWKRKVSIVEFALTIQHWHQSLQCWLQCSTKKKNKPTLTF